MDAVVFEEVKVSNISMFPLPFNLTQTIKFRQIFYHRYFLKYWPMRVCEGRASRQSDPDQIPLLILKVGTQEESSVIPRFRTRDVSQVVVLWLKLYQPYHQLPTLPNKHSFINSRFTRTITIVLLPISHNLFIRFRKPRTNK